jgi:hypothetical protein
MGVMRYGHARSVPTARVQTRRDAPAEHPSAARWSGPTNDHDTYAKAQDCAHFQPEGQ